MENTKKNAGVVVISFQNNRLSNWSFGLGSGRPRALMTRTAWRRIPLIYPVIKNVVLSLSPDFINTEDDVAAVYGDSSAVAV